MASYLSVLIQAAEPANYKLNYDEHYMISVPFATTSTPGIASFDGDYFKIAGQKVTLSDSFLADFNNKLDKETTIDGVTKIYGVTNDTQEMLPVSVDPDGDTIAMRHSNGRLQAKDGSFPDDLVTKRQLDAVKLIADSKYLLPPTGIPESVLSADVVAKLNKDIFGKRVVAPEDWPVSDPNDSILYLVGPMEDSQGNEYYTEYLWIYNTDTETGVWEAVGSTAAVDLSWIPITPFDEGDAGSFTNKTSAARENTANAITESVIIGSRNHANRVSEILVVGGKNYIGRQAEQQYKQAENSLIVGYEHGEYRDPNASTPYYGLPLKVYNSIIGGYRVRGAIRGSLVVGSNIIFPVDENYAVRNSIIGGEKHQFGYSFDKGILSGSEHNIGDGAIWNDISGQKHAIGNNLQWSKIAGYHQIIGNGCEAIDIADWKNKVGNKVTDSMIRGYSNEIAGKTVKGSWVQRESIFILGHDCTNKASNNTVHQHLCLIGKYLKPTNDKNDERIQIFIGQYNKADDNTANLIFGVGCGSDNNHRDNAFSVHAATVNGVTRKWIKIGDMMIDRGTFDDKLDKITGLSSYAKVYVKTIDNTQSSYDITSIVLANAAVLRKNDGNISVPNTPVEDGDAASKKYVDDSCGALVVYRHDISFQFYQFQTLYTAYVEIISTNSTPIIDFDDINLRSIRPVYAEDDGGGCYSMLILPVFYNSEYHEDELHLLLIDAGVNGIHIEGPDIIDMTDVVTRV